MLLNRKLKIFFESLIKIQKICRNFCTEKSTSARFSQNFHKKINIFTYSLVLSSYIIFCFSIFLISHVLNPNHTKKEHQNNLNICKFSQNFAYQSPSKHNKKYEHVGLQNKPQSKINQFQENIWLPFSHHGLNFKLENNCCYFKRRTCTETLMKTKHIGIGGQNNC